MVSTVLPARVVFEHRAVANSNELSTLCAGSRLEVLDAGVQYPITGKNETQIEAFPTRQDHFQRRRNLERSLLLSFHRQPHT